MSANDLEIVIAARDTTGAAFRSTQGHVQSLTKDLFSLKNIMTGTAGIGAGIAARSFTETASSFERMEIQLDKITKGKGAAVLDELNQWAMEMPVNTEKAVDSFRLLMAMGLNPTMDMLQTLTDVSSIFDEDTLSRLSLQLGQMAAKGKIMAQDLNIMAEAGINARKYLQDAFGMTVEELQGSGIEISRIVAAIFAGMKKEYGGSANDMMTSWAGLKTVTKSYFVELEKDVMAAGVFDAMKEGLGEFNDELKMWVQWANENEEDLKGFFHSVGVGVGFLGDMFGAATGKIGEFIRVWGDMAKGGGLVAGGAMSFGEWVTSSIKDAEPFLKTGGAIDLLKWAITEKTNSLAERIDQFDKDPELYAAVSSGLRDGHTGELIPTPQRAVGKVPQRNENDKPSIPAKPASIVDAIAAEEQKAEAARIAQQARAKLQGEFDKEQEARFKKNTAWQIQEIEKRAANYKAAGADAVAVTQWSEGLIGEIVEKNNQKTAKSYQTAFDDYMVLVLAKGEAIREIAEEERQAAEDARQAEEDRLRNSREWQDGATRGLADYASAATDAAANVERAFVGSFNSIEDALVKMVTTGKLDFSTLVNSIVADLVRISVAQSITGPIAAGLGQFIGSMGGSFAGTGTGSYTSPDASFNSTYAPYNHTGGIVGQTANRSGTFPSAMFDHAPRFHKGLMPDEFPAILQKGEAVIPRDAMRGARASGTVVNVNVKNSPHTPSVSAPRENADGSIDIDLIYEELEGRMASNVAEGRGSLAGVMESTFGADRTYGASR